MMKFPKTLAAVLFLLLSSTATQAATLGKFTLSENFSTPQMEPVGQQNTFSPTDTKIYATCWVENATQQDNLRAVWLYHPTGSAPVLMTQTSTPVTGTRQAMFSFVVNKGQRLDYGLYSVKLYLNNNPAAELFFTVQDPPLQQDGVNASEQTQTQDKTTQSPATKPDDNALPAFTAYDDPAGRFSVKLPGTWFPAQVQEPTAVYISQNKVQNPVQTIAISAYPMKKSGIFNRMDAILSIRDKLLAESKSIKAETLKDSLIDAQNEDDKAWALAFTYPGPEGQTVVDKKLILSSPNWIYVLNFMYTPEASPKMRQIAQTVMESFNRKK